MAEFQKFGRRFFLTTSCCLSSLIINVLCGVKLLLTVIVNSFKIHLNSVVNLPLSEKLSER